MLAIGAVEIKLGGLSFLILITGLTAVMIWELARLTDKRNPRLALALAALPAVVMIADEGWPSISAWAVFPLVPLAFLATERAQRNAAAALATAIMISGHGLFVLRDEAGIVAVLWLLGVVITSDVMGYFVGRLAGGPEFWPAISPKKTWSGTVAGWIGAAALGGWFVLGRPCRLAADPSVAADRLCRPDGRHRRKLDQAEGGGEGCLQPHSRPWRADGPLRCAGRRDGGGDGAHPLCRLADRGLNHAQGFGVRGDRLDRGKHL